MISKKNGASKRRSRTKKNVVQAENREINGFSVLIRNVEIEQVLGVDDYRGGRGCGIGDIADLVLFNCY